MPPKRRRSSASKTTTPPAKRTRTIAPNDRLSSLSSELIIRILHHLPLETLLICQTLSHRFYTLTSDSQIWKSLYYTRFVLPRALRIPGIKSNAPSYSSRLSKWLDDEVLVNRKDGNKTQWKGQYKLRHNWSRGACEVKEIKVSETPSVPGMLVKLAEGVVITVEKEDGLRARDLKGREIAACGLVGVPTCVAIDESDARKGLGIAIGFQDGGWGCWRLDVGRRIFERVYRHPGSSNGMLNAIAFANPYVLTITDSQLLSLYTFTPITKSRDLSEDLLSESTTPDSEAKTTTISKNISRDTIPESTKPDSKLANQIPPSNPSQTPHLLASLKSHTSKTPLSLSIRPTLTTIIASIAYTLPTLHHGTLIGLQELHISPLSGTITSSRLTSALPGPRPWIPYTHFPSSIQYPTASIRSISSLSYSHPYILATHPDNTLSLYLCTSTREKLEVGEGTRLFGHTSSVASAEITSRGKAVSVSTKGDEVRVWSLEGGFSTKGPRGGSIRILKNRDGDSEVRRCVERDVYDMRFEGVGDGRENRWKSTWLGFDDEVVVVLRGEEGGGQAVVVYDFT
ncbi:hypothetical protein HYFRA_00001827 [Hymenoscyphus fraxineus]|uniref:F-box domain-containing protein n=1 Tax=Hymenoscyphus fraxineus TaxID=746836 RepID=A0A9N9KKS7_9HELO|nr:hypothetical protein HYFRA_00001827 [Hymenoscyphus fraxineus]